MDRTQKILSQMKQRSRVLCGQPRPPAIKPRRYMAAHSERLAYEQDRWTPPPLLQGPVLVISHPINYWGMDVDQELLRWPYAVARCNTVGDNRGFKCHIGTRCNVFWDHRLNARQLSDSKPRRIDVDWWRITKNGLLRNWREISTCAFRWVRPLGFHDILVRNHNPTTGIIAMSWLCRYYRPVYAYRFFMRPGGLRGHSWQRDLETFRYMIGNHWIYSVDEVPTEREVLRDIYEFDYQLNGKGLGEIYSSSPRQFYAAGID